MAVLVGAVVVLAALLVGARYVFDNRVVEEAFQPVAVATLGTGGDPLVILVGVKWNHESFCPGQFHVSGTETSAEVSVGQVVSRTRGTETCADVRTLNQMAWVQLTLASPLDGRRVIRASDGAELPVFNS